MSVGVSRTSFSFQRKKGRPHNKHFGKRVRCMSVFKQDLTNIITLHTSCCPPTKEIETAKSHRQIHRIKFCGQSC